MPKYPKYAEELISLLENDQTRWRSFWREHYKSQGSEEFTLELKKVRQDLHSNSERMLSILEEIQEPSLSNIGKEAAQAVSIIALHDSLPILKRVLSEFEQCYRKNKSDTYYQAIPSMVDRVLILERKSQRFGTQWEFDNEGLPFLPTTEDFEHINKRRAEYDIEALRWPRSLAMPVAEQQWLQRPISELIMRDITSEEFRQKYADYLV